MKYIISLYLTLGLYFSLFAQHTSDKNPYIGRYGDSAGIWILEDGQFLLYGNAMLVFGRYHIHQNYIEFLPDRRDMFEIYGHHNPELNSGESRFNYFNFEDGNTFAQYDQDSIHRVFNIDANCFPEHIFIRTNTIPQDISLYAAPEPWYDNYFAMIPRERWSFGNKEMYNDFILVYNHIDRERLPFYGATEGTKLILSNFGGEDGYRKQDDNEEDNDWQEILLLKEEYKAYQAYGDDLYSNRNFKISQPELKNYTLDESTNQYMVADTSFNAEYFAQDPYHDDRMLRKYVKMNRNLLSVDLLNINDLASKTIFHLSCKNLEGYSARRSNVGEDYYDDDEYYGHDEMIIYDKDEIIDDEQSTELPLDDEIFTIPFGKENGFYAVNRFNYMGEIPSEITDSFLLETADVQSVEYIKKNVSPRVVTITFTKEAAEKFTKFTRDNLSEQIVFVFDKEIIFMPIFIDPILSRSIQVSGYFGEEQAQGIVARYTNK